MNQTTTLPDGKVPAGKLVIGVALLLIGTLAFIDAIDLWEPGELWRFWPLILIVSGLGTELDALRTRRGGGGGFVVTGIGVWMLAGSLELFDLNYATAFPLGVIVVGLGTVIHALFGVQPSEKKNDERQ